VRENAQITKTILVQLNSVVERVGESLTRMSMQSDGSTSLALPFGAMTMVETAAHSILSDIDPLLGESYPVPVKQRTDVKNELANRLEWRYYLKRTQNGQKKIPPVARKLRINGESLLTFEYDRETQALLVMADDKSGTKLLLANYDKSLRPVSFRPLTGDYASVELEYDRYGRIGVWKWGDLKESYTYAAGRLTEIKYADDTSLLFTFKDDKASFPLKITTPRRSDYLLAYDDAGALQSLTTPRGHIHAFGLQTSLGFFKFQYFAPIQRHPFEILYNDDGQILAKIHPH